METCADELAQQCLLPIQILSLEPEHRKNRLATTGAVKDRKSPDPLTALKLLALSVDSRRNCLLSSKLSK